MLSTTYHQSGAVVRRLSYVVILRAVMMLLRCSVYAPSFSQGEMSRDIHIMCSKHRMLYLHTLKVLPFGWLDSTTVAGIDTIAIGQWENFRFCWCNQPSSLYQNIVLTYLIYFLLPLSNLSGLCLCTKDLNSSIFCVF